MKKQKRILVTGAKGFVGANTAKYFKSLGFETYGIGHGDLSTVELLNFGLDHWRNSDITIQAIRDYAVDFDVVVHCGGSGSVGFSVDHPYLDFKKTVDGTLEILEYIRLYSPNSYMVYPSSPAVQGEHPDIPIVESFVGKPCSPYGYHKKIAEELCHSYSEKFGLKIGIVRLFSVYGIGLKKQLLWDAVQKIKKSNSAVEFWGTGNETRDFIHIDDVVKVFEELFLIGERFFLVNGGTGNKFTINDIVNRIKLLVGSDSKISFNNQENPGNPVYYWASIECLEQLHKFEFKRFDQGLAEYVRWACEQKN
ncbi:MAG: NAD(P)-dependent oxidoreductase [Methyloprofundus sp.]|nr:NAD(P)-dependent oxidoreductase [Methyloprofundus sp.]